MNSKIKAHLEAQGKYKNIVEIHGGACAYSFSGHQTSLSRDVFLKVYEYVEGEMINVFTEPRHFATLFKSGVRSENLVELFDVDVISVEGERFVCCEMEYVDGPNLYGHLQNVCIGQQDAIKLTLDILNGLSCLHEKSILHRDLKLANIIIKGETPKIADLGSAAILKEGLKYVNASKNSTLYLAPEGFGENPKYFLQSDLYQIGVVLYELINGPLEIDLLHYFTSNCKRELRAMGKNFDELGPFEQNRIVNSGVQEHASKGTLLEHGRPAQIYFSNQAKRYIKKLTSKLPSERFQSCAAASAELSRINVPNWKKINDENYFLEKWQGYDFKLYVQHKAKSQKIVLEKSIKGKNNFLKVNKVDFDTLDSAVKYVNEM